MAVNFPDSPANGDSFSVNDTTYVYNATAGYWDITSTVQASASTSTNAPSNPSAGDFWFDPSALTTYIYYSDGSSSQWVPANSVGARGAPGPGYPTAYYSVDYTSTATGNVVFNSSSSPTLPSYTVGKVNAWVNGVLRSDIDATDGSNVEISLSTGDEVQIINFGDTDVLDPTASSNDHTTYTTLSSLIDTVQANVTSAGSGVAVYATPDLLPLSGINSGEQAYVNSTNRLYINNGTGWYSIGLVNNNPSITSVQDASAGTTPFTLATDGAATVITITASDPEDVPLTYSYAVTSGSLTNGGGTTATVVQGTGANTNKFTITPSATEAYSGTFELTFTTSDGVNTATSANSFTLNFITAIENSNHTTLLATATGTSDNNNITDSSSNNHSITVNGDTHAGTFSPYRSGGYSTYFDGNDYLTATHTNPLGTADFTVEGWINFDNVGGNRTFITLDDSAQLYFRNNGSSIAIYGISGGTYNFSTGTPDINTWYHFAFVRQSGSITLYWDGQSKGSVGCTDNFNSGNLHIGCWSAISEFFQGHLTDVKISNTAVYTSNFSVPTERLSHDSSCKLITCHLPYIADGSNLAETIVVNGDPSTKPFSPYDYSEYSATDHGGSVYFDGSGDRITASTSNNFAIGSSEDFIIEAWIYPTNTSQGNFHLFGIHQATYTGGIYLDYHSSDFRIGDYGQGWDVRTTSTVPLIYNTWQHICASRTGNLIKIFFNGESLALSSQGEAHTNSYNAGAIAIGGSGVGADFQGFISDIRFEKGTSRTSNFTLPTAPLSSTGAELHIKGTDASIIDKSQSANLKLVGNTTGSTTQVKFSNTKSMYFDGSGDYISIPADDSIFSKNYTIEFWMYPTQDTNLAMPFSKGVGLQFYHQSGNIAAALSWDNSAYSYNGNFGSITTNAWSHISLVRDSSVNTYKFYINGTLEDTLSSSSNISAGAEDWIIGGYRGTTSYSFQGYIQDVRVTKGLTRYTANFTPPTAPLEG